MEEGTNHTAAPHAPFLAYADGLRRSLEERLSDRDRDGFIREALDAVQARRIGVADLYTQVLGPLMVDVGERWHQGRVRVWDEHLATQSVLSLVGALTPHVASSAVSVPPAGRSVLLTCPPGEQHDLGLRMLADRFRLAGWNVYYLGADTPVDELVAAGRTLEPDLLVLSASTHYNRALLRDVAAQLRSALPEVRLAVGGPAFAVDRQWPAEELLDPTALGLPGTPQGDGGD